MTQQTQAKPQGKYRSIIIDTVNSLQNDLYLDLINKKGNLNFDEWKDFAIEVFDLFNFIKDIPNCTLINVLGYEGSGKSFGVRSLNPLETMYMNCDNKDLPYFGWQAHYNKNNQNYSVVKSYDKVKGNINHAVKNRKGHLLIFTIHHIITDKKADGTERERMRTLGKMATKLNVDGVTNHVYYTDVDPHAPEPTNLEDNVKYFFKVHTSGSDTCRTPFGFWENDKIPNNYQLIVDRTLQSIGEKTS